MTITRLVAKNFKSLKNCEIELSPLTVLVGENSSGKSSVLQVLGFLAELEDLEVRGNLAPLNAGTFKLGTFDQLVSTSVLKSDDPKPIELGTTQELHRRNPRSGRVFSRERTFALQLGRSDIPGQAEIRGVEDVGGVFIPLPSDLASSIASEIRAAVASRSVGLSEDSLPEEDLNDGRMSSSGRFIRSYNRWRGDEESLTFIELLELGELYVREDELAKISKRKRGTFYTVTTAGLGERFFCENYPEESLTDLWHFLYPVRRGRRSDEGEVLDGTSGTNPLSPKDLEARYSQLVELAVQFIGDGTARVRRVPWNESLLAGVITTSDDADKLINDVRRRLESTDGHPFVSRASGPALRHKRRQYDARTTYLGGLRSKPSPISEMNFGPDLVPLGIQGEYEAAVREGNKQKQVRCPIIDETGKSNSKNMTLNDAVGYWLSRFGIAKAVRSELQGNIGYQTKLVDIQTDEARDPTFYGVGASQLLPVITLCLLAEPGDTVLIEQPELHVHPGPQQVLGDFLIGITEGKVQVIVETHSEYLVNRLRRRMVESSTMRLEERLSILYASRVDGSTTFERLKPTPDGSFEYWPDGFFDQGANESEQIMRAVISKRRANQPHT